MLKCNLAVLLAERKLKISKVSADTGISRTTLTALSGNQSQGIQFDTLNTLCSYLRITPAEFFCYAPFEFNVKLEKTDETAFEVTLSFVQPGRRYGIPNDVYLFADVYVDKPLELSVSLPDDEENTGLLRRYMKGLPPILKRDLEQLICEAVYDVFFKDGYEDGDC